MKILFEDNDILVCEKLPGIPCESALPGEKCLADVLIEENPSVRSLFLVHRLDRNTGGVTVLAKNKKSAAFLSAQIAAGTFKKRYFAVTDGIPAEKNGVYKDLLFKDSKKGRSYVVDRMRKGVKEASLEYETLGVNTEKNKALVKILLHTGRTHQIRVQFSSRKTPLCGDGKYGSRDNKADTALWAFALTLNLADGSEKTFRSFPDTAVYPWNLFSEALK